MIPARDGRKAVLVILALALLSPVGAGFAPEASVSWVVPDTERIPQASWNAVAEVLGADFTEALQTVYLAHFTADAWDLSESLQAALPALHAASTNLAGLDQIPTGCNAIPDADSGRICIGGTGDDDYTATPAETLGGGGDIFIELGGNDTYRGGSNTLGSTGGIFIDLAGDDRYEIGGPALCKAECFRDGALGANGGLFLDVAGDDVYLGGSNVALLMGASHGLFIELDGNDHVDLDKANAVCQPASICSPSIAFRLEGALGASSGTYVDRAGDDYYASGRSESLGVLGTFLDLGGDDVYIDKPGFGHAFGSAPVSPDRGAVGFFLDAEGDDIYETAGLTYGFGYFGIFADLGGDDEYGAVGTGFGHFGLFLDVGGEDQYPSTPKGLTGVFIDTAGQGPGNSQTIASGDSHTLPIEVPSMTPLAADATREGSEAVADVSGAWLPEVVALGSTTDYEITYEASIPVRIFVNDANGARLFGPGSSPEDALFTEGFHFTPTGSGSATASFSATQPGRNDIELRVMPLAGSVHLRREALTTIFVDGDGPEIRMDFDDGAGSVDAKRWHNEASAEVRIRAADELAGMMDLFVTINHAPDPAIDQPVAHQNPDQSGYGDTAPWTHTVSLDGLADGSHTVYALALDAVGNAATMKIDVHIDRSAPTWIVDMKNGTRGLGNWWVEAPEVWLEVSDAHAGVAFAELTWTGATQHMRSIGPMGAFDASVALQDGISILEIFVQDEAHGPNTDNGQVVAIHLDRHAPITTIDLPQETLLPVSVTLTAQDATSDVAVTEYEALLDGTLQWSGQGTSVVLDQAGDWVIRYRSQDVAGNWEDWQEDMVEVVSPPPIADFTIPSGSVFATDLVQFMDASTDDGFIKSWSWDFGDGASSMDENPTHAYDDDGTYTVTLTVTDDVDQSTSISRDIIIQNNPPVADFSWSPAAPVEGQEVTFTDASTDIDGFVTSYSWSMDGESMTGTSVKHRFESGTYDVSLEVVDDDGATNSLTRQVEVKARPPLDVELAFTPSTPTTLDEVTFTAAPSVDPDDITSWSWTGVAGSGASTAATFDEPGSYDITIEVADLHSDTTTATVTVHVAGIEPMAAFALSAMEVLTSEEISFTDLSSDVDGSILAWDWNFGDGHTSIDHDPSHSYVDDGTYAVTLTVTDNHGLTHAVTKSVNILNRAPSAEIDAVSSVPTMTDVDLAAITADEDGAVETVTWDFGDGSTATGDTVTHSFSTPGTHKITVTVTDDDGASVEAIHEIEVTNQVPTAAFSMPESVDAGSVVSFTDASTDPDGSITSWAWDFGNGESSSSKNPTHTFTPGTYTVTLTVTDDAGAEASASKNINVRSQPPTVTLEGPASLKVGEVGSFTATGFDPDGTQLTYAWILGEVAASGATVAHAFTAGEHGVEVTVTDEHGDTATAGMTVTVTDAAPTVSLTPPSGIIAGAEFSFASAVDDEGPVEYTWDFGDGSTSTEPAPQHKYAQAGTYTVTLAVTDLAEQTTSRSMEVTVAAPAEPVDAAETVESGKDSPGPFWLVPLAFLAALRKRH